MVETSASPVTIDPKNDYIIAATPLALKYFERFNVMMGELLKENSDALAAWKKLAAKQVAGLQLMTRTQSINVTGVISFTDVNSEFDLKMIDALGPVEWLEIKRCLTALNRLTIGASKQTAYQTEFKGNKLANPAEVLCIDSAGFQYQLYDYNSGPMLTVSNDGTTERKFLRNPATKKIMDDLYEEIPKEFAKEIAALGIEKMNGVLNQHNYIATQAQDFITHLTIQKAFKIDFFVNAKSGGGFFSDDALAEIADPLWNPAGSKLAEAYIQHLIWNGLTVGLMRLKNDPQLKEAILNGVTIRLPYFEDNVPRGATFEQKAALARDREAFMQLAKELDVKIIVDRNDVFNPEANQGKTVASTTSADSITVIGDEAYAAYAPKIGAVIYDVLQLMAKTKPRQYIISEEYETALKEKLFLFEVLGAKELSKEQINAVYKKYGKEEQGTTNSEIGIAQGQSLSLPLEENAYMEYQRTIDFIEALTDQKLKGTLSPIIGEANKFCASNAKSLDSAIARNISLGGVMKANPHTNTKVKAVAVENGQLIDFEARKEEVKSANADILRADGELSRDYAKKLKGQKQQDITDTKKIAEETKLYNSKGPIDKLKDRLDRIDVLLGQDSSNNPRYFQEIRRCRQQIQMLEQREKDIKTKLIENNDLQKRYLDVTKKADKIIEGRKIKLEFISKLAEAERLASALETDTGNAYEAVYKLHDVLQKLVELGALEKLEKKDGDIQKRYDVLTEKINQKRSAESVVVKNILMDSILGKESPKVELTAADLPRMQNDEYSKDLGDLKLNYSALRQFAEQNKEAINQSNVAQLKNFLKEYIESHVKDINANVLLGKELTHKELADLKDLLSLLQEHQKIIALNPNFKQEGNLDALKTLLDIKIHCYEKLEAVIDKKTADAEGPRKMWIGTKSRQVISDCREAQKKIFQAENEESLEKARAFIDGKSGSSKSLKGAMDGPEGINNKFAALHGEPAALKEGEGKGSASSHKSFGS